MRAGVAGYLTWSCYNNAGSFPAPLQGAIVGGGKPRAADSKKPESLPWAVFRSTFGAKSLVPVENWNHWSTSKTWVRATAAGRENREYREYHVAVYQRG